MRQETERLRMLPHDILWHNCTLGARRWLTQSHTCKTLSAACKHDAVVQGKVQVPSRSMRAQAWVKARGPRMSVTRSRMRINCRELNRRARKSNRYRDPFGNRLVLLLLWHACTELCVMKHLWLWLWAVGCSCGCGRGCGHGCEFVLQSASCKP